MVSGTNVNNYTMTSDFAIYFPSAGTWTFDSVADDQYRLTVSGLQFSNGNNATITTITDHQQHDAARRRQLLERLARRSSSFPPRGRTRSTCSTPRKGAAPRTNCPPLRGGRGFNSAFQLVGDRLHGGLQVSSMNPVVGDESQDAKKRTVTNPGYQASSTSGTVQTVNFLDSGAATGTHYSSAATAPSNIADQGMLGYPASYAGMATGSVTIPAGSLTQSFGVNSHEGFRLTITGATFSSVTNSSTAAGSGVISWSTSRTPTDTFGTVTFPSAGAYTFTLEWYGSTSGSEIELFSTAGSHGSWVSGGTN